MTWKRQLHTDLGAAIAGHPENFQGVAGFVWRSPEATRFVYAVIAEDGIHVPLAGDDQVVQTVEEAEALLSESLGEDLGPKR